MTTPTNKLKMKENFDHFLTFVRKETECWIWTGGKSGVGYGRYWYKGKLVSSHRHSFEHHYGPIKDGYIVMHTCDTPSCVNPKHLKQGTHKENTQDCLRKKRQRTVSGESHYCAKLTREKVKEIRRRYKAGGTSTIKLGKEYGVSQANISAVIIRKTWKEI